MHGGILWVARFACSPLPLVIRGAVKSTTSGSRRCPGASGGGRL